MSAALCLRTLLSLIMDVVWTLLPVVVLCAEAQNLTVVTAALGQDAALNCSVNTSTIHWYVEIHSQVRGLIAQTFDTDPSAALFHVYTTLTDKYVAAGNRLLITNIMADDYRLYFCARRMSNNITFIETFHLVSDVAAVTDEPQQSSRSSVWCSEPVLYGSFILNVLILVLTGVGFTSVCLKKKKKKECNYQVTDSSPTTNQSAEMLETPQYEEILLRAPPPAASSECIYYKAQLPHN